jgi:hypothetical protein
MILIAAAEILIPGCKINQQKIATQTNVNSKKELIERHYRPVASLLKIAIKEVSFKLPVSGKVMTGLLNFYDDKKMKKKNIPFEFVFDYLFPLDVIVKPMFGLFALYINEKIVLILRQRKVHPETNGVWVAINQEHHEGLKNDLPSLRSFSRNSDAFTETEWQLIPVDTDDFEKSVIKVCEFIKHGDPRIGRIPKPRKRKKKR